MSAVPAPPDDRVPSQDEAHARVRHLLEVMIRRLQQEHPGIGAFVEARPCRDRSSGRSWQGIGTMVHVSALLATQDGVPSLPDALTRLAAALDAELARSGLSRCHEPPSSLPQARWRDEQGFAAELVAPGVVAVRVISGDFLPGSLEPLPGTSPITPPPRRVG